MTDWEGYAVKLIEKFDYQNTYYHKEPRLDIATANIASEFTGKDFIISSDVFEHVVPPVSRAFENIWKMLKPGGVFVLTVPYGAQRETVEHFPELNEFSIVERDGSFVLRNKTRTGVVQEFNDLVFHGGPGTTLEMRVFSEAALIQHLKDAGFADIKVHRTADLVHGIWWPQPWSLPLSARRPKA
jgi:SAM-dependent methyltransferase